MIVYFIHDGHLAKMEGHEKVRVRIGTTGPYNMYRWRDNLFVTDPFESPRRSICANKAEYRHGEILEESW